MGETKRVFVGIDLSRKFSQLIPMLKTTVGEEEGGSSGGDLNPLTYRP